MAFRPNVKEFIRIYARSNGVVIAGTCTIDVNGDVEFFYGNDGVKFPAAVSSGWERFNVTYNYNAN
jgi:PDZ domain-containing secreted protein